MGSKGQQMWAMLFRRQVLASVVTGAGVALTVLGVGLGLIKFHGGMWPWWFHGVAIALLTGLITAAFAYLHVREVSRQEARRLAGEKMSHEMCTALQILVQCAYLPPDQRVQVEREAVERLRVAVREILPNIIDVPANARPVASVLRDRVEEEKRKSGKAGGAAAG
jgi:multisubunit Na+/H+ antiporter MnhG subunit